MKKILIMVCLFFSMTTTVFAEFPKYLQEGGFVNILFVGAIDDKFGLYVVKEMTKDYNDLQKITDGKFSKVEYAIDKSCIQGVFIPAGIKNGKLQTGKEIPITFSYNIDAGEKKMYVGFLYSEKEYIDPTSEELSIKIIRLMGESLYYVKHGKQFYGNPIIPEYIYKE